MSFLSSKTAPFKKTTSSNDKIPTADSEKKARKILGTFHQNHGLTPFKKCTYFNLSYMVFLYSKKAPFEKRKSANDKTNVSFTEK